MTNLYEYIYQFWSGLFFQSPMLDGNFYASLTTISIFALVFFVFFFVYKLIKMFMGGNKWF